MIKNIKSVEYQQNVATGFLAGTKWNIVVKTEGLEKEMRGKTMRQERFKMEREGLVTEGQEVEISERSAVTGQYTYLVEPSIAMSGIYRTSERIKARTGIIRRIEKTEKGFYLVVEVTE